MTKPEMTRTRLEKLLAAYGADPARWPAEDRQAAAQLSGDSSLRASAEEARRIDRMLGRLPQPQPASDALYSRLMAVADRTQPGGVIARLAAWLPGSSGDLTGRALAGEAATLAMALAAGLWLAASGLAVQAESMDLSPYVLGGELALLDEGAQ